VFYVVLGKLRLIVLIVRLEMYDGESQGMGVYLYASDIAV